MPSPQSLSEPDRRTVALWAADCAERVLHLFEAEAPEDDRPRDAVARSRAFRRGELDAAGEIARRFVAGRAARDVHGPAAVEVARAAAQASGVAHMGAHALGAAGYAALAVGLAHPDQPEAVGAKIECQVTYASDDVRAALLALPPVGENSSGPLGPGLRSTGELGVIISRLQAPGSASQVSQLRRLPVSRAHPAPRSAMRAASVDRRQAYAARRTKP